MATEYIVTITRVEKDVAFTEQKWQKLVDVPDDKHPEIYGYVNTDITRDVETKIYEQVVDDLKMPEVIKAINGMK